MTPGLNLVCGDNGIGKTTLLESLAAIFSEGQLSRLKRRQGSEAGRINIAYSVGGEHHSSGLELAAFTPEESDWSSPSRQFTGSVILIRASRDFGYIPQPAINRDPNIPIEQMGHRVAGGLDAAEIKYWFSNRYLFEPHSKSDSWSSEMIENLQTAKTFFSLLDPSVTLSEVSITTYDIIVSTPSGKIPFEYLSSGFKSSYILLLGIVKEIEFRKLEVSAKDFSGVIIIDELDLHLHPVWQRKIGGLLKNAFPQAQIIASTHSPHVIQGALASEVLSLTRDASGKVRQRKIEKTKYGFSGWSIDEILEDIMGVEDTKTQIFRDLIRTFDDAIDGKDGSMALAALVELRQMLHPGNPLRKLLEIEVAPFVADADQTEGDA